MDYIVNLGEIATRHDEKTGTTTTYSLSMINHKGFDEEYQITVKRADQEEEELLLSLWSAEAQKLADLINNS